MSSRQGRESWHGELPTEVLDAVREESDKTGKPMWEILNDSARMFLGLDEVSTKASVQRHIDRLEDDVQSLREEKQQIEDELSDKEQRLADYREKLESIEAEKEDYETRLDDILDELEEAANKKVIAFRSEIKQLATDHYGQPTPESREKVKEDLWDRVLDQKRDIARYQFNETTQGGGTRAAADGTGGNDPNQLPSVQKLKQENSEDEGDDEDDDDPELVTDGGTVIDTSAELIDHINGFYRTYYSEEIGAFAASFPDQRSLRLDWRDIYQWDKDVAEDILNNESQIRAHFEEALQDYDLPAPVDLTTASVRFINLGETYQQHCDELRAEQIGQFREVKGQVKQRTGAKPVATEAAFECQRCGTLNTIPQQDGDFEEPHECQGCERQGPFSMNYNQSTFKDQERLRIQEPPERAQGADGRYLDVVVDRDLVDSCNPGDRVRIAGTIDAKPPTDGNNGQFEYELEGRGIEHTQETYEEIELDQQTVDEIKDVARNSDPFETLQQSIAPGHHGDDHIKLSIALQLFGGVRGKLPDGSRKRGDPHVLLIGDPGVGKSTLLEAAENIAPRSASASGKGASKAGLTAAALPSDFADNGMTLEAGALVLADKGLAAIDEIDKIPDEVSSAMHSAMGSNQRVDINKGGFSNVSLPSRTAVLAAGNPKRGRFDKHGVTGEQLELPGALMDRFDLIWAMQDDPDPDRDERLSEHILDTADIAAQNVAGSPNEDDIEQITAEVDQAFIRHWIAYAKQNYHPTLSSEAKKEIREFYTGLRSSAHHEDDVPIPVTARKIEGIIRLAQASARVRLAEEVSLEDAQRAKHLVERSMVQVGVDPETGDLDADVVETGTSKTQRDRIKNLEGLIDELDDEHDGGAPIEEVVERADDIGMNGQKVEEEIEKLRRNGELYEPKQDHIRLT